MAALCFDTVVYQNKREFHLTKLRGPQISSCANFSACNSKQRFITAMGTIADIPDVAWVRAATAAIHSGQRPADIFPEKALGLHLTFDLCAQGEKVSAERNDHGFARNFKVAAKRQKVAPTATGIQTPAQKLIRFLRLLSHLGTAPWAAQHFDANADILRRLTASHIQLITGEKKPDPTLYALIGPGLERCENLVWITNRQQGKTTTMGRFIAALSLACQVGGTLACVYSTKQDRAAELCQAAKAYIYWMQLPTGRHPDWPSIEFDCDNHQRYTLRVGPPGSPSAMVCARPKNADACRGDAPSAAFFDEIAFTSANFWYQFALPLLQIRGRRFTCTTTPPPPQSFFDTFCAGIRRANAEGTTFFELINHSLSCQACIDANDARRCCHKLHLVPPWKSMMQLNSLGKFMPKNRAADMAAEVFGVMQTERNSFLPMKLIEACMRDRRAVEPPVPPGPPGAPLTVWIGIDLAGHTKSEMGLVAIVGGSGKIVVIGSASVPCGMCEVIELQMVVREFLKRVRAHPWIHKDSILVPVIECNLNEVVAMSMKAVFESSKPYFMPFTTERFRALITPGVGVWTTEDTKMASIQCTYQALLDGQLFIAETTVTVGRDAFDNRAKCDTADDAIDMLQAQLIQFRADDRGKVTGKTADGQNDDIGMAFLLALYWRLCVMADDHTIS